MFIINTTQSSTATGASTVVAKGHGKQRTVRTNPAFSPDQNHAAAAGALLNVLTSDEQQAKVKHPSGGQRVRMEHTSDAGGKRRWTIEV